MEATLHKDLQVPMRRRVTVTLDADGKGLFDAGPGRSFVGIETPDDFTGEVVNFYGYTDDDPSLTAAAYQLTLEDEDIENMPELVQESAGDGADPDGWTQSLYATSYHPLPPVIFNGVRLLAFVGSDSNDGITITMISKPV